LKPDEYNVDLSEILQRLSRDPKEQDAWRSLYRGMWPFAVACCYRRLGRYRETLCEDAAQLAFVRLLEIRPFPVFAGGLPQFKTYLDVLCKHICLDMIKAQTRREVREQKSAETPATSTPPSSEELAQFREIVDTLNPEERQLLRHLAAGRSMSEVASILRTSVSSIARKKELLKSKLQRRLHLPSSEDS
jgi:RNA polymerase sigma factor (sigma-70 family)